MVNVSVQLTEEELAHLELAKKPRESLARCIGRLAREDTYIQRECRRVYCPTCRSESTQPKSRTQCVVCEHYLEIC